MLTTPFNDMRERRASEDDFERARKAWPTGFTDSREAAQAAWDALSDHDRIDALAEIPRYVAATRAVGRKHFCTLADYLVERRWTALPEKQRAAGRTTNTPKPIVPPKSRFLQEWEAGQEARRGVDGGAAE